MVHVFSRVKKSSLFAVKNRSIIHVVISTRKYCHKEFAFLHGLFAVILSDDIDPTIYMHNILSYWSCLAIASNFSAILGVESL